MADRFFRDIRIALDERDFNYDTFEECVCDLLRDTFPGIVPILGGADAGMDGAIPTGDGPPMPVIVTTAQDVIGNLTRNLNRYLTRGGRQRAVVLVTSRELTPRKRENLDNRAQELDFNLVQVFERRNIARLLYHRPDWCGSLLNLSGQPATLTEVPSTRRVLLPIRLIGRAKDLEWLCTVESDSVLVGEPGAGKTFLLSKLVENGGALFVASDDETAIANDLRRSQPRVVIVDDAHSHLPRVDLLRRLRPIVHADFAIIAVTWPWRRYQDDVAEALGGAPPTHALGLLTRDEIVEVVDEVGIKGPNELVRAMVVQSANKPGLAVTLGVLCLQGASGSVVRGEALSRNLLSIFRQQVGRPSTSVLACFAMGGEAGMAYENVSDYLRMPIPEVRETAEALAAGGVLTPCAEGVLAVEPTPLRAALVRDEVLSPSAPLDYRALLEAAEDASSAVDALVAGVAYGAVVEREELQRLVVDQGAKKAWQTLSASDPDWARWGRANYPGPQVHIAGPALHSSPEDGVAWLLEDAERAGPKDSEAMTILDRWVVDAEYSGTSVVNRRKVLAEEAVAHRLRGGSSAVFWKAVLLALSLRVESTRRDPGAGATLTWSPGRLIEESVADVAGIWTKVRDTAAETESPPWPEFRRLLQEWVEPQARFPHVPVSDEERELMKSFAGRILRDVAPRFAKQPGVASQMVRWGAALEVELDLLADPYFETIYPAEWPSFILSDEATLAARKAVRELGSRLATEAPDDVAERLSFYEQQAEEAGRSGSRLAPELATELARSGRRTEEWIRALAKAEVAPDLLAPFLDRLANEEYETWPFVAEWLLGNNRYQSLVAERILCVEKRPEGLEIRALQVASRNPQLVENLCWREGVDRAVLRKLLNIPERAARLAAVVGLWSSVPRAEIPSDLMEDWRAALLSIPSRERGRGELVSSSVDAYWLGQILASDSRLAFDWIRERFDQDDLPPFVSRTDIFKDATAALDQQQRRDLLGRLPSEHCPEGLIALVVERDVELYRELLERQDLAPFHLVPLQGVPDDRWWELAQAAVASGHSPAEVADASLSSSFVVVTSGTGVDRWRRFEGAFGTREDADDPVERDVADAGLRLARQGRRSAEERARERAIRGYR